MMKNMIRKTFKEILIKPYSKPSIQKKGEVSRKEEL